MLKPIDIIARSLCGLAFMGRTRRHEKNRRERSTARKERTSAGHSISNVDWQCPYCSQWFSQKRNGPGNHLRFCAAHRLPRLKHPISTAQKAPVVSVFTTSSESSSELDSESLSDSSSESDAPVTHRRHAQKVRSPSADEPCESYHFVRHFLRLCSHFSSCLR